MARTLILLIPVLALAACTNDPIAYIPPTDRALLQAQARMTATGAPAGPVSVDEVLRRARGDQANAATSNRLVLQFANGVVQPDAAQKANLASFAAGMRGRHVVVESRQGSFDAGASLLGPRRAIAVARELEATLGDVEMRFLAEAPENAVIVRGATP